MQIADRRHHQENGDTKKGSKHNATIAAYTSERKGWKTRRLGREFSAATQQEHVYLGFIPDAFRIDVANKTVWLLEVDGDSYTRERKLRRQLAFLTSVDGSGCFLHQTTINLLTGEISIIDDEGWCRLWNDAYTKRSAK